MSKKHTRAATRTQSEPDAWTRLVRKLPFQGRVNRRAFDKAFKQLTVYEDWVADGRPDTIDHMPRLPSWYLGAAYWNDTAFQYLRHAARAYFRFAATGPTFGGTFISIARRMRETAPTDYSDLVQAIRNCGDQFERQHRNAGRANQRARAAKNDEQLEIVLQWYGSFFETNLFLWFLCVVARFMRTGRVEPDTFGGPATRAPQGSLVRQAVDDLAGTPLQEAATVVYDTELRNALSHNDYELTDDDTRKLVLHPGGRTLTRDEVWEFLMLAQEFHEGLLGTIATIMTSPAPEDWYYLREYGVVTWDAVSTDDGPLTVLLHQLWCFAELDPDGCWLDSAELTIGRFARDHFSGSVTVRFGTAGSIIVPDDERLSAVHSILRRHPWVVVTRYPVAPYLGLGYPRYGNDFEVVGKPDEHLVPYGGDNEFDPATLAPRGAVESVNNSEHPHGR
jgi:hypothetical protein